MTIYEARLIPRGDTLQLFFLAQQELEKGNPEAARELMNRGQERINKRFSDEGHA